MGRKLKSIYELFSDYTEKEISDVISLLDDEEKQVIKNRYGDDLHNPKTSENWDNSKKSKLYNKIIPKIKKMLSEKSNQKNDLNKTIAVNPSVLVQLLKEEKSTEEICKILKINKNIFYEELLKLKNFGCNYIKKYYYDGTIKYKSVGAIKEVNNSKNLRQDRKLITDINENNLKFLVISDLHFGNELDRIDLVNRAYDYCIKHNINTILCGGDIIDGVFTKGNQKITDVYKQIEYFLKNYPQDKNILTFSVGGDHDLSALNKYNINLIDVCDNYKHDFIIGGYNNSLLNIKNDTIHLFHHVDDGILFKTKSPIILHGHSHKFTTTMNDNKLNITIPSLSDINYFTHGALELDLFFENGLIKNAVVKHLYFEKNDNVLSESEFNFKRKNNTSEVINNTENINKTIPVLSENKLVKTISQIDKFNTRWNRK